MFKVARSIIIPVCAVFTMASCSRTVTPISSNEFRFQTASVLHTDHQIHTSGTGILQEIKSPEITGMQPVANKITARKISCYQNRKILIRLKAENTIRNLQVPRVTPIPKAVKSYNYDRPHINKAGFILIAAGILAFALHLIPIAWIVLLALGLIILFGPFLRKRQY